MPNPDHVVLFAHLRCPCWATLSGAAFLVGRDGLAHPHSGHQGSEPLPPDLFGSVWREHTPQLEQRESFAHRMEGDGRIANCWIGARAATVESSADEVDEAGERPEAGGSELLR
jgi:hypothetical protein